MATRRRDPRTVLNQHAGSFPACFEDSEQYHNWLMYLRMSKQNPNVGICVDCTPRYKLQMLSEGRCAHPETKFAVLRNSFDAEQVEIIGVSSKSIYWAKVEEGSIVLDGAYDGKN